MPRLVALFASIALAISVALLVACGGTGSSAGNNTPAASSPSPPSGSGSGSSAGGSSGSASGGGSSGSAGSGSTGSGGSSGAGGGSSSSFVAYAYTAGSSEIRGYGVSTNGSLTPLSGSPYAASLAGNIGVVTNGANLYAIAGGNSNLDIFSIDKSSGELNLAGATNALAGDPNRLDFASGLALDHTGASLYVVVGVSDFDGGFNVFAAGSSPSAQQSQYLQTGAYAPAPLVFAPNNQFGYTFLCTIRTDGVFGFTRASDGSPSMLNLGLVVGPKVTGQAFCPDGLAVSAKGYLAGVWKVNPLGSSVSGNQTYVTSHTINADGMLTAVPSSQVQTASTSAHNLAASFDPSGTVLAVAGDGGIQTFSLNGNGTLTPIGSSQAAGANFQGVAWDNSNHVFATSSNQLYVFSSSNGTLVPVSGSPYPGDSGLAVLPLQ